MMNQSVAADGQDVLHVCKSCKGNCVFGCENIIGSKWIASNRAVTHFILLAVFTTCATNFFRPYDDMIMIIAQVLSIIV